MIVVQTDRHRYLPRRIVPKNLISGRSKCPERFPVIPYPQPPMIDAYDLKTSLAEQEIDKKRVSQLVSLEKLSQSISLAKLSQSISLAKLSHSISLAKLSQSISLAKLSQSKSM